jgi:hypothetical protein
VKKEAGRLCCVKQPTDFISYDRYKNFIYVVWHQDEWRYLGRSCCAVAWCYNISKCRQDVGAPGGAGIEMKRHFSSKWAILPSVISTVDHLARCCTWPGQIIRPTVIGFCVHILDVPPRGRTKSCRPSCCCVPPLQLLRDVSSSRSSFVSWCVYAVLLLMLE